MYRHGLGDCFLLSFPRPDGGEFFILIDCGVILGTPEPIPLMNTVAQDILVTTRGRVDVLVATHEHWDHISGFDQARYLFEKLDVGQVWMAWTENPANATARRLKQERAQRCAALRIGLNAIFERRMQTDYGASDAFWLFSTAEVLTWWGIDAETDVFMFDGAGLVAAAHKMNKTEHILDWLRSRTPRSQYWNPGDLIELPEAGGVRVYVLGPPTSRAQLFKDLPTRSGREVYEEPSIVRSAAQGLYAGAAVLGLGPEGPQDRPDLSPFDPIRRLDPADARRTEFFRDYYFGLADDESEDWRRIETDWVGGISEFALKLDAETNNTSLALAFELPDGRVLLFPGDAQVGNWESWHVDEDGRPRVWTVGDRRVTAEQLLNRTVLYKVSHHGSQNATLRQRGLEMMTAPDLVAMVPVDRYIAHLKKGWTRMPFPPLMDRLAEMTGGRLIFADEPISSMTNRAVNSGWLRESEIAIEVIGDGAKFQKRPLYVDYLV
jgi:hypothetical protein